MKNTFKGSIQLEEVDGMYEPASEKVAKGLDEIVEKINERFKGDFTDADKVIINALLPKLIENFKLTKMAKTSDPKIFRDSIFSKAFSDATMEEYMESQDSYSSLFEDKDKFEFMKAVM